MMRGQPIWPDGGSLKKATLLPERDRGIVTFLRSSFTYFPLKEEERQVLLKLYLEVS
jgi:hypothetical protein